MAPGGRLAILTLSVGHVWRELVEETDS